MNKNTARVLGTLILIALCIAAAPYIAKAAVFAFVVYLQIFAIIVVGSMLCYLIAQFFDGATREDHADGSTSWNYEF